MPMKPEKRAFLVRVLGEERVKSLEEALPLMEQRLMASGVGWASLDDAEELRAIVCPEGPDCATGFADTVTEVVVVPAGGPVTFEELEKEDAAREKGAEVRSLTATFEMLISNIMGLPVEDQAKKVKLLEKAVGELKSRISRVGEKALGSGAGVYVADLVGGGSGAKSADQAAVEAEAKRLEESRAPAAALVSALMRGGAVPG